MRKIAAHRIVLPDGQILSLSVVELNDEGCVVSHHPLEAEEAAVEFYPGEIDLQDWYHAQYR